MSDRVTTRVTATEGLQVMADAVRLDRDRDVLIKELAAEMAKIIQTQLDAERLRIR